MNHTSARRVRSVIILAALTLLLLLPPSPAVTNTGLAVSTGATPSAAPSLAGSDMVAFTAELEQIRKAMKLPGMSAAIVQDQEIVWAAGLAMRT